MLVKPRKKSLMRYIGNDVNDWCPKINCQYTMESLRVLIMTAQDFVGPLKPVMIGKDGIDYVQSSKWLGVTIDNHLNR